MIAAAALMQPPESLSNDTVNFTDCAVDMHRMRRLMFVFSVKGQVEFWAMHNLHSCGARNLLVP